MANAEHLMVISRGAEAWNAWRTRNWDTRPDFRSANMEMMSLSGANLKNADLVGAKLCNAQLFFADFDHAILQEADLKKAMLRGANMSSASLFRASLDTADLRDVTLSFAQLTNADFQNAILTGTNFYGASVEGANFENAFFAQTILSDLDLSKAIGLEKARHVGPSEIGIRTIYKSKGKIPDVFLRGSGVPEEFIRFIPSFVNQPIQFYSCFISYSHEDRAFAQLLHDTLQGKGIRCWLDDHQLLPGDDLYDSIDNGIKLWDKVLLCASKTSLTSWWVDNEINRAFEKEAQLMKQRGKKVLALIPINLDDFLFNPEFQNGKGSEIRNRVSANFVNWERNNALFTREIEKVVRALKTNDAGREAPPISIL